MFTKSQSHGLVLVKIMLFQLYQIIALYTLFFTFQRLLASGTLFCPCLLPSLLTPLPILLIQDPQSVPSTHTCLFISYYIVSCLFCLSSFISHHLKFNILKSKLITVFFKSTPSITCEFPPCQSFPFSSKPETSVNLIFHFSLFLDLIASMVKCALASYIHIHTQHMWGFSYVFRIDYFLCISVALSLDKGSSLLSNFPFIISLYITVKFIWHAIASLC